MLNYPIKFSPLFKEKIWGGSKLKTVLHKNCSENNIGESWEISDINENASIVAEGEFKGKTLKELIVKYKGSLVGKKNYASFKNNFPLLIKFIDTQKPLSIQVHPNNSLAKKRHNHMGKNEMWYIMQAEKNAKLVVGLKKGVDKLDYINSLKNNSIEQIIHTEKVAEGDTFFVPAGKVHAIGSGILLVEIQQTSDITYRIYDYNRVDPKTKKKRDLHTNLALDAIDFNSFSNGKIQYENKVNVSNKIIHTHFFKVNKINVQKQINVNYSKLDSFVIYIGIKGTVELKSKDKTYILKKGETILLPATIKLLELKSTNASLLEVFL